MQIAGNCNPDPFEIPGKETVFCRRGGPKEKGEEKPFSMSPGPKKRCHEGKKGKRTFWWDEKDRDHGLDRSGKVAAIKLLKRERTDT